MKKRIISALLATSILLTCSACGAKKGTKKGKDNLETSSVTQNYDNLKDANLELVTNGKIVELSSSEDSEIISIADYIAEHKTICSFYGRIKEEKPIYGEYFFENSKIDENNIIGTTSKNQKVLVNAKIDNFYQIQDENGIVGYVDKNSIEILPKDFIEVDISSQTIYLYLNDELILTSPIISGKANSTDTREGYFEIYDKNKNRYLSGANYKVFVNYWMPFDGGIGLHDASWRKGTFGGEIYKTNGSHGCVNLPDETAKTIYENYDVKSKVLVHK